MRLRQKETARPTRPPKHMRFYFCECPSPWMPIETAPRTFSNLVLNFFSSRTFSARSVSTPRSSVSSSLILLSCSASDVLIPGSTEMRYSICCSLMIKSRASSRCRLANVRGESGAGGRLGSSPSPAAATGAAPGCCGGASGGDALPAMAAAPPALFAIAAGTGGADEFFVILASAGAESGTFDGGVVGALSWYVVR